MDAKSTLSIVTTLSGFLPNAKPLHDLLVKYHAQIEAGMPILDHLDEAPSALAAAEKAAPELAAAIRSFVASVSDHVPTPVASVAEENVARVLIGKPPMTADEESKLMDAKTAQVGNPSFGG